MKKIILIIYIALFYVSLQVGYAQGVLSPQNLEDEFITVGEPMLGFPLGTGNDEIPDLKFGFRTNFDVAILNEVAIRAAARRNLRNWYDKQTGIIERILETKYGTSFPSFNAAKDHAFLEYERPSIRTHAAPIVNSNIRSRDQRSTRRKTHIRGLKALKVREAEIKKGNINNPLYPNIEVNNIPLKNIRSIAAFNSEYNKLLNEFTDNKWREFENNHIAKILGTPFNEEVIKIRNQRYNGFSYWDRLDFMQFLINFEEFKRLSTPPYILTGEAARIFNKYISKTNIVTTSTMVTNYINANKANELSLFHPNYWKVILKRDYGNSPFRIDDAIRKHEQLKAAEIRVLIHSISINATTTIDYLVNKLKITDEYQIQFLNDNPELGTLFNNQIDAAIKEDRNRPPGIPGQLSFPPDFSYQGAVSSIRNELIKGAKIAKLIAEVGIADVNQKKWLYENESEANDLRSFVEQNGFSSAAKEFASNYAEVFRVLDGPNQIKSTGKFPDELSSCCPGSCCPDRDDDYLIMLEFGVKPLQQAIQGVFNLFASSTDLVLSGNKVGKAVRALMKELEIEIPNDVTNEQLAEIYRIRKKEGILIVEYRPGLLESMLHIGLDTLDVLSILSPSKGGGAFLAIKTGGSVPVTNLTKYLRAIAKGEWKTVPESMSDAAKRYQEFITKRKWNESFVLNDVKFDGVKNVVLSDAKSGMLNFVNPNGTFKNFFTGVDGILRQARRQRGAAGDLPIEWHFEHKIVRDAYENLLKDFPFDIKFIHTPL